MVFSKAFPRHLPGSSSPVWEEITLSEEEEQEAEEKEWQKNRQEIRNIVKGAGFVLNIDVDFGKLDFIRA